MKYIKVALVGLLIVLFVGIFILNSGEEKTFTISDELLTYEDEVKEDKINSIYIFYMSKDEGIRELHLGKQNDEAAMQKIVEELHGININKLNKDDVREIKESIIQINPSDTDNWTGSVRLQDKIADRIYIFSNGEIIFKMPEQASGKITPDEVFYKSTEFESEKCQTIMEEIEAAYSRRHPEISK